ncbi:hypothetical protein IT397_03070 [Candidatus Nomurabacteria bacterium]|nr:hypothetical protein [Candidatus Nomurabacteria bacterium]
MSVSIAQVVGFVILLLLVRLYTKSWEKMIRLSTGFMLYSMLSWFYDNPLWWWITIQYGALWGSLICTVGVLVINPMLLLMYQRGHMDWVGIDRASHVFEDWKANGDKWIQKVQNHWNPFIRFLVFVPVCVYSCILWMLKKNNILAFLILSILEDSFITTVFLKGGKEKKLNQKDVTVFFLSSLVSCSYWSLRNIVALEIIKTGWRLLTQG